MYDYILLYRTTDTFVLGDNLYSLWMSNQLYQ